jgi:hypothetical protein
MDFDTRANMLSIDINESWDDHIKNLYQSNKEQIKDGIYCEYGPLNSTRKLRNFIDLGAKPISIVAFHNNFNHQLRNAFIIGSYYPALTAACALGERILNHMILILRDDYKNTPQYKSVYSKESFDNWSIAIDTLEAWGVLTPSVKESFKALEEDRNRSLHFNPTTDTNDRSLALDAIKKLNDIISNQFSGFGAQPWFIPDIPGSSFIKKEYENHPFIKKVYIQSCHKVGPYHRLDFKEDKFFIIDENVYEDKEITDDEFREMFLKGRGA